MSAISVVCAMRVPSSIGWPARIEANKGCSTRLLSRSALAYFVDLVVEAHDLCFAHGIDPLGIMIRVDGGTAPNNYRWTAETTTAAFVAGGCGVHRGPAKKRPHAASADVARVRVPKGSGAAKELKDHPSLHGGYFYILRGGSRS